MPAVNTATGLWFINTAQAATLPTLIMSNTIVNGAPAVLTTQGTPPATDAGAWIIVGNLPLGSVSALAGTAAAQIQAAHTHAFTGSAADTAFVLTGGITAGSEGFTIGTDADINHNGDTIKWIAFRQ